MVFTFEQIKELHEMGFTAEEIINFNGTDPGEVKKEPEKKTEPEKEKEQEPEKEPEGEQTTPIDKFDKAVSAMQEQLTKGLSGMSAQLTNLVKQMQSNNVKTASVNILPDDQLQKDTDSAMAELIRPSYKKKEE